MVIFGGPTTSNVTSDARRVERISDYRVRRIMVPAEHGRLNDDNYWTRRRQSCLRVLNVHVITARKPPDALKFSHGWGQFLVRAGNSYGGQIPVAFAFFFRLLATDSLLIPFWVAFQQGIL